MNVGLNTKYGTPSAKKTVTALLRRHGGQRPQETHRGQAGQERRPRAGPRQELQHALHADARYKVSHLPRLRGLHSPGDLHRATPLRRRISSRRPHSSPAHSSTTEKGILHFSPYPALRRRARLRRRRHGHRRRRTRRGCRRAKHVHPRAGDRPVARRHRGDPRVRGRWRVPRRAARRDRLHRGRRRQGADPLRPRRRQPARLRRLPEQRQIARMEKPGRQPTAILRALARLTPATRDGIGARIIAHLHRRHDFTPRR